MVRARLCRKYADNFAMPAMDAIKDANGKPCIFRGNFFEGVIMSHRMKKAAAHFETWGGRRFADISL